MLAPDKLKPTFELIKSLSLPDFPSGSSLTFYQDNIYLIGDDATDILVLDAQYNQRSLIHLFDYAEKRIPKPIKQDFETSTIVHVDGIDHLLVLGSGSSTNRKKGILIPLKDSLHDNVRIQTVDYSEFIDRLERMDFGEINIEGSTVIGNHFILSNRANSKNLLNKLIITEYSFWKNQAQPNISVSALVLPGNSNVVIGVSELCYLSSRDMLLMTLSTELTDNAYEDGPVGDSYIGWVEKIESKVGQPTITLDGMQNLAESNAAFQGEKIEGICVERAHEGELIFHLISDDDLGHSTLFKVKAIF